MKKRLMLSNAAIVVAGFCFAFLLVALLVQRQYQNEFIKRMDATLAVMATQGDVILENPQKYTKIESRYLSEANQQMRITILDTQGNVIGDSEQDGEFDDDSISANHLDRPEIKAARETGRGYDKRESDSVHRMFYYAAVYLPGKCYIRTAMPTESLDKVKEQLWLFAFISMLFGIGLVCLITWFLVGRFTDPVKQLGQVARKISEGDFSSRMPGAYSGEVGELAGSFNAMAENTENAVLQLQKKQDQLESVLQGMDDGVLCVDQDNKILFLNQRAGELLHAEDLKEGGTLDGSMLIRRLCALMRRAAEQEGPLRETLIESGTNERQYQIYAAQISGEREQGTVLAVISDVTRMRRLEQLRSEFVANVTHELKTPLTSIRGSIELLKSADRDEETRRYFYDVLDIEAERLHHLIDDMLVLSQIENAREDPSVRRCNLREELENTVKRLEPVAGKSSVTLELSADATLYCDCSPIRLQQLFGNLIENGIKYNVPQGKVTITAQRQRRMAVVRIRDTGIGIAPEHFSRLFERFYRVDTSRSRQIGGTGLGLSIVKHLVALYNGEVSVESALGQGSTFTIRLPLSLK